ncbi:hypothetical protein ACFQL7_27780 [Halocatena marina]|uniref:YrhK domain-containing protein n=1 Tax=Halocatena marina TaxID=2934937 RepID=A0ABD5YXR1_9EURY
MVKTLTALSQRNGAFWFALALIFLGGFVPETLILGETELSKILMWIGGGILLTRVLVAAFRILKTAAKAGAIGYREGESNDS